jgi:L-ascorbate metabolism protein UlaG (beta-lactamase superfamily)
MAGTLTWLGHSAFRLDTPGGKRIYVDPWLGNPLCPESEAIPERIDVIALTHGHSDHVGGVPELIKEHRPPVVAGVELTKWLSDKSGVEFDLPGLGLGGSREIDGVRISFVDARHSNGADDLTYLGCEGGLVMRLEDGFTIYFTGDTCAFLDMQLIARLHSPDLAVLPIGGHFTMGPEEAAVALELIGVTRCVPCHYATFPLLAGTPEELRRHAPGVEVLAPEPGEAIAL